ncbi:serine hydrolase domain-containing protein [Mucilaginibacter frigoritolerans]|nr:serine hydrolase domain-containing protein [Mucilaginibacter frigoritolerans]
MKIRLLPILAFVTFLFPFNFCFAQLNSQAKPVIDEFEKELSAGISHENLHVGISVAILKDGKLIWLHAYGFAKREGETPADTNTIYRIGSITKTFTAVLLMQLVQEGKIELDDPVEHYLPEIKKLNGYADAGTITFRQLASHTSGLKREPDMNNADVGPLSQWEKKLISCIPYTSFNSKPGEAFLYSNIGYALLGLALSRVTGVPYITMVQQRIFTPLNMNDTFFALPDDKRSRLAEGIDNNNKGTVNTSLPLKEIEGRGYRVPNGGIFSTPRDLSKFVASLMGTPQLLSSKSMDQMQVVPPGGKNYGMGLALYHKDGVNIIGHNGSVPGYTAQFAIEKQSGYAVIIMRNYNSGLIDLERTAYNLLKLLKNAE